MGNLVGKYAEWEVNEEESKDGEDIVEGIVCEASNQDNDQAVVAANSPKSGDKRKRSSSVEPANKEDGSATKKPRSPGTRVKYYEELPVEEVVAKHSVSEIPIVIDENNYSSFSKEELVTHPRRSLRQTPMKEDAEFVKATPRRGRPAVKQEPKDHVNHEVVEQDSPSPKKKLFATPKKSESPKKVSPKKISPKKGTPKRATPKKATPPKKSSPSPKKVAEPTPKRTRKPSTRRSLM